MTVTEHVTPAPAPDQLPPMDVASRVDRLREALGDAGCDGVVVSNLTNVRYLTGFTGSAGLVLVTPDRVLFVTDGRYTTQSAQEIAAAGVDADIEIVAAAPDEAIAAAAAGLGRLGLESATVTWAQQRRWAGELFSADLVPTVDLVETLRLTKDAGEAARIRSACAVADAALARMRPMLTEAPTEAEFALELDSTMRRLGAEDVSFETIVASGPNGAKPHHRPGTRQLAEGDLVVIDFGALVDGYHSDMTRTFALGDVGPERLRMLEVVLHSQSSGTEAVAAGGSAAAVDDVCRTIIDDAGWAAAFMHSTGHGVGLDIHEEPRVSARSTATLLDGYVVTVEPGVYLEGIGGVRIEDTVLVTEGGCDRLTLAPKDPFVS